jgi:hypothetical protein
MPLPEAEGWPMLPSRCCRTRARRGSHGFQFNSADFLKFRGTCSASSVCVVVALLRFKRQTLSGYTVRTPYIKTWASSCSTTVASNAPDVMRTMVAGRIGRVRLQLAARSRHRSSAQLKITLQDACLYTRRRLIYAKLHCEFYRSSFAALKVQSARSGKHDDIVLAVSCGVWWCIS